MWYLIPAVILVVLALACGLFAKPLTSDDRDRKVLKIWAVIFTGILVVFTLGMSVTVVGARAVGIQTSFGKYRDTLSNGFQFTAPWSSVEEFSTRIQYLKLSGDQEVPVTFKGGGGGTVLATQRWTISPAKAEHLWKKYKTFEHVRDQLVGPSTKDSFRVVLSQYAPNDARDGKNLRNIESLVEKDLSEALADDGILIDSVSVQGVHLDRRSQESLDKIVTANNDIVRAKSEQLRAKIDAETARIRNTGGSLTGPALQRYCLEVINNWNVERNGLLPAGFGCLDNRPPFVVTGK